MATQRDLSLAYSPGVAVPVLAIAEDPSRAYDYTVKGNFVAVITNGTAILGLGNRGALAAKPVMEGKAVLFKRFADIDSIDLEVSTEDPDQFINCVSYLGDGWGGINLEDIKAPECFIIEQRLRELLDIPVFHDDQHGTAIISAAGLINALDLTGRDIEHTKLVCNGAGAAGIACLELLRAIGFRPDNLVLAIPRRHLRRPHRRHEPVEVGLRGEDQGATLAEALKGADVSSGLSLKGAATQGDGEGDGGNADYFRHGQSDPEITVGGGRRVRSTPSWPPAAPTIRTRSTTCSAFPIFPRRARRARARDQDGDEDCGGPRACRAGARRRSRRGRRRLRRAAEIRAGLHHSGAVRSAADLRIPPAVAKAAMETTSRASRLPTWKPIGSNCVPARSGRRRADGVYKRLRRRPRRVVFAEGEEEQVIRAAATFVHQGLGSALLVGREAVRETAQALGVELGGNIEIINAALSSRNSAYAAYLYERLQRQGFLQRDCQRLVNQDRNHFAACMVALGDADAMVTGVTRISPSRSKMCAAASIRNPGHRVMGVSLVLARGRTVLVADTAVTEMPMARISPRSRSRRHASPVRSATIRVALLAFSTFGHPAGRAFGARAGSGAEFSTSAGSISNTMATWPLMWR